MELSSEARCTHKIVAVLRKVENRKDGKDGKDTRRHTAQSAQKKKEKMYII